MRQGPRLPRRAILRKNPPTRCHALSLLTTRAPTPLAETRVLCTRHSQGTFGIHDAKIVAPGDPFGSVLYFRMAKLGPGHMPYIGSSVIDQRGLELIHDWIRQLPAR